MNELFKNRWRRLFTHEMELIHQANVLYSALKFQPKQIFS